MTPKRKLRKTRSIQSESIQSHLIPSFETQVLSVFPKSRRKDYTRETKCVLGIRLGGETTHFAQLKAVLSWIEAHFQSCQVLVGDSMFRHHLRLVEGHSELEARGRSLNAGREFASQNSHLFSGHKCRFEIVFGSQLERTAQFRRLYNLLSNLYVENSKFGAVVKEFGQQHLENQPIVSNTIHVPAAMNPIYLCSQLILEELSAFGALGKRGWSTLVHLGERKVMAEIGQGNHPGVPEGLKRLVTVSLNTRQAGRKRRWLARGIFSKSLK